MHSPFHFRRFPTPRANHSLRQPECGIFRRPSCHAVSNYNAAVSCMGHESAFETHCTQRASNLQSNSLKISMTRSFLVREPIVVTSAIRMAKVLLLASGGVWHAAAQVCRCVNIPAPAIATPPNSARVTRCSSYLHDLILWLQTLVQKRHIDPPLHFVFVCVCLWQRPPSVVELLPCENDGYRFLCVCKFEINN